MENYNQNNSKMLFTVINPFGINNETLAKMYPDLIITHLSNSKIKRIGHVKAEIMEIIILETKTYDRARQYEFLTVEGKTISVLNTEGKSTNVLTIKKDCEISFYICDGKQLVVDCDTPVYFSKVGSGINSVKLTGFKPNLFGIPNVYEYNGNVHYRDIVINNYKTHVVEINNVFHRIFYGNNNFIMFKHKVVNYGNYGRHPICDVNQIQVEEELQHLFVNITKEQFISLCELIELDEFTNLPDALTYIGHLKKVEQLDMEKNKACINIIEEFINLSKKISKEKLKTLAKMFV